MQSEWYDIHIHALPDVDDGAKNIEMTGQMLQQAYSEGTHHIIFTPHYREGMFMTSAERIWEQFEKTKALAKQITPELCLYLGSEIYFDSNSIQHLKNGRVRTLAESSYVLVEFSYQCDYLYLKYALGILAAEGYRVILAHFERYECLKKHFERLEELVRNGVYLQMTAKFAVDVHKSLFSGFFKKVFKEGWVHFIATDAHNSTSRSPGMKGCINCLYRHYHEEYIDDILFNNPHKVILNQFV